MRIILLLTTLFLLSMTGCTENDHEDELSYKIYQEGGIMGTTGAAKTITVDAGLLESMGEDKGNFLTRESLSKFGSTAESQPDAYVYRIEVLKNNSSTDVFLVSESQLTAEQLDFIDTLYDISKADK